MDGCAARDAGLTAPLTVSGGANAAFVIRPSVRFGVAGSLTVFGYTPRQAGRSTRILGCITGKGEHRGGSLNVPRQASFAGIRRLACAVALAAFGALLWAASPALAEVGAPDPRPDDRHLPVHPVQLRPLGRRLHAGDKTGC